LKYRKFKSYYILFVSVFLILSIFISQLTAQNQINPQEEKYVLRTFIINENVIEEIIVPGPPERPTGFYQATAVLPQPNITAGVNVLSNVPAYNWSFGCTATSAAMIAGYYDRTSYPNMYTGPTNGGVMPINNSSWPDWYDGTAWRHQCPLSATRIDLDGRIIKGHVDDYWISYESSGPDPWDGNWTEHQYGDCTGDYMKTNQWFSSKGFNTDGSTVYYSYTDGSPISDTDLEGFGLHIYDGPYGNKLFYESRGYNVTQMFTQRIQGQGTNLALGYTYDQYMAEIDAGRPVMIHVVGHTMVGMGYDNSTSDLMYIHDTWDYNTYTMIWGSTYSGMQHIAVSIVTLAPAADMCTNGSIIYNSETGKFNFCEDGIWVEK